jgi:hypothetical protein
MKKLLLTLLFAAGLALPASAQTGSKIITNAVLAGQTGAMQSGADTSSVVITFCGTGFSGDVYVDTGSISTSLTQAWTATLVANSDCTTVYTEIPASKWHRARWTRTAGTLNIWMAMTRGGTTAAYGTMTAPTGATVNSLAVFLGSPLRLSYLAPGAALRELRMNAAGTALEFWDPGYVYNATTKSFDVTDGRVQAVNFNAIPLSTPGSITVTPRLTQVGTITTVAGSAIVDGDYFTIRGTGASVLPIEFDASPGDGTAGGRVPYVFAAGDTADQIRDGLITLINGATVTTHVVATSGGAATINLAIDAPATAGGTSTENVANAGFGITGFADPTHATTVTYKLVCVAYDGTTTEAGAASTTTLSTATLSAANSLRLAWTNGTGCASGKVYRTVAPTSPATTGIVYSGTALTVDDTGLAGGGETAPTTNGTGTFTGGDIRFTGTTSAGLHLKTLTTTERNALTPGAGDQIYNSTTQRVEVYGGASWQGRVGILSVSTPAQATTGTAEEILGTYTLPANTLSADGKALRITVHGIHAANANSGYLRVRIGGLAGALIASMSSSSSGAKFRAVCEIIRTASGAEQFGSVGGTDSAAVTLTGTIAADTTAPIGIVVTGATSVQAGDVTLTAFIVEALN